MSQGSALAVWTGRATLGEGPLWSARLQRVIFVDIKGRRIVAWSPADGAAREWPMAEWPCWLVERADGDGFIAGLRNRLVHLRLDLETGPEIVATLAEPEADLPGNRFNDGKADPFGNVWFGSMEDAEENVAGSLWRLDADGAVSRHDDGYGVANGPAISTDGSTLYHTDSMARTVYAFDLTADGTLANKRVHIRFAAEDGYPDGMTCDTDGGLWVAHFAGGRITRFLPDGTRERSIALPCSNVTSVCFFGEALDRLAVTTAAIGPESEEQAGSLFVVEPGVRGTPARMWGR